MRWNDENWQIFSREFDREKDGFERINQLEMIRHNENEDLKGDNELRKLIAQISSRNYQSNSRLGKMRNWRI